MSLRTRRAPPLRMRRRGRVRPRSTKRSGAPETCYHALLSFALRARLARRLSSQGILRLCTRACLLCVCACSSRAAAPPAPAPPAGPPSPPAAPWFTTAMAWAPVTQQPFVSEHFGERHLAEVRVNPEAQATYAALVPESSFATGTVIVETLRNEKTGAPGPVLALERTESDWRYWRLGTAGNLEHADASAACARCHAAAPAAPLFGLPRTSAPQAAPSQAAPSPAVSPQAAPSPAARPQTGPAAPAASPSPASSPPAHAPPAPPAAAFPPPPR